MTKLTNEAFRSSVWLFGLALATAAALTPVARRWALRWGLAFAPSRRDIHCQAIPRTGGVALAVAVLVPLMLLGNLDALVSETLGSHSRLAVGLCLGGALSMLLGLIDDTHHVRALHKLACQLAIAAVAYQFGFRINAVFVPYFGVLSMGVFALPVSVLWIVGVVNAVNLIDGLDGLAAGVVFCAALTNFVVAAVAGQAFVAFIMSAIMGAVVGFLFYNFNPARIFMGDAGSYFLGFLLATVSLTSSMQKASTAVSLLVPVVALGLPIFDTLLSIVRRTLQRRPMFSPDRGHLHHRLMDRGITHRRAVMILYGASVVLTLAAIGISLGRSWEIGVAIASASVVLGSLIRFAGYFDYSRLEDRAESRRYDATTQALLGALPDTLGKLAGATSLEELWLELVRFCQACEHDCCELESADGTILRRWARHTEGKPPRDVTVSRYALGPWGSLEVGWHSEDSGGASHCDLLLQLLAAGVRASLEGTGAASAQSTDPATEPVREGRALPCGPRPAARASLR